MRLFLLCLAFMSATATPTTAEEPAPGRITGMGGIFFKSEDPAALAAWYSDVLGINVESWGGAILPADAPGHPPYTVWGPFKADTDYFQPSTREFMLNFAVDDLDAFIARIEAKGVTILKRDDSDPNGKFAWIMDPQGLKIELWQPAASESSDQTP
ncbi:MAG: VOC family protein [Sphingobium sp.]